MSKTDAHEDRRTARIRPDLYHRPRRDGARATAIALSLVLGLTRLLSAQEAPPAPTPPELVRVLLVHGQNNHDDARTARVLEETLTATGRFRVQRAKTPERLAAPEAWTPFRPDFGAHDVVLLSYNGELWPPEVRAAFLSFLEKGGGAVAVHAANNAFVDWKAYDALIGLGWRGAEHGTRIVVDDETGAMQRVPAGEGPGAGHGRRHAFQIKVRDPKHPIMAGLPPLWRHGRDELYHGQRGPAEGLRLLSSAWSDPKTGGTGQHEPITWWIPHGKGRFVTTVLGHQWAGQQDQDALDCVGFRTVLARAVEWAGTGAVTLPVPATFPTADEVRLAPAKANAPGPGK